MRHRAIGVAGVVTLAGAAWGQISQIGPFTGPHTEGFETQAAFRDTPYECLPGRIFAGTADICDHDTEELIVPQFWSLSCTATAHGGTRYVVGLDGPLEGSFDNPVVKGGGYFGVVGGQNGGTVEFFNAAGGSLGTGVLTTNLCTYVWNGWQSVTPFSRVRIVGHSAFGDGGYIHMDDLEYGAASAPACYPNCDASTAAPALNTADFTCFLQKYAAQEPYANCDGSTAEPTLNTGDFTCFLQRYAAGCP